jgi:PTS system beta-glucosides-specific IIC component
MDYQKTAEAIVEGVGGAANVQGLTHCVTRLRFRLADEGRADEAALKATDGVMGVVRQGGQYQVIIGNEVDHVFDAISPLVSTEAQGRAEDAEAQARPEGLKGWLNAALDTLISCFTPLIPAIAGAGMVKVLAYILSAAGLVGAESLEYFYIGERKGTDRQGNMECLRR